MRTYVIAEGITMTLTNRTADAYENYLLAEAVLLSVRSEELWWDEYDELVLERDEAYARFIGERRY